jgi:hypothetical protein
MLDFLLASRDREQERTREWQQRRPAINAAKAVKSRRPYFGWR